MDRETMTNEENYCFDVAGYLHVPGTLTRPEVERLNREIDAIGATEGMLGWPGQAREPFRDLLVHPALVWYLNQLVGQGGLSSTAHRKFGVRRPATRPRHWSAATSLGTRPLRTISRTGGASARGCGCCGCWRMSRRGDGGFVLVPCSHKGNVATPEGGVNRDRRYGAYLTADAQSGGFADRGAGDCAGDETVERERTPAAVELRIRGARRDA